MKGKTGGTGKLKRRASAAAAERRESAEKVERKYPTPARTYRRSLPQIAEALAEQARRGSYLHARALKEIVDAEQAKKGQTSRREERWVKELLERLDGEEKGLRE